MEEGVGMTISRYSSASPLTTRTQDAFSQTKKLQEEENSNVNGMEKNSEERSCRTGFTTIQPNVLTVGIYHSFAPVVAANIPLEEESKRRVFETKTISSFSQPELSENSTSLPKIYPSSCCSNIRGRDVDLITKFASTYNIALEFKIIETYNKIWEWAGKEAGIGREDNQKEEEPNDSMKINSDLIGIDLCIAGLAPLKDRQIGNAQWSLPYYYVQRSILIRRRDYRQNRLRVFEDFAHYQHDDSYYESSTKDMLYHDSDNNNNNNTVSTTRKSAIRRTRVGMTKGTSAQDDLNLRKDPSVDIIHIKSQEDALEKLIITEEIDGYGSGLPCNEHLVQLWNDAIDQKFDEIESKSKTSTKHTPQTNLEDYIERAVSAIAEEAFDLKSKEEGEDEEGGGNDGNTLLERDNYKLELIDIHWMDPKEKFCAVINNNSEGLLECFNNYILSSDITY